MLGAEDLGSVGRSLSVAMGLLQLFIVNSNGGLMFNKALGRGNSGSSMMQGQSINDMLRIASTFHSIHEISKQMAPVRGCTGIQKIETSSFMLYSLCSLTGVKFVVTSTPETQGVEKFAASIYELYADYVLKNPFYELDQPINVELFSNSVDKIVATSYSFRPAPVSRN